MDSFGSGFGQVVSFCGCGVAGRMPVGLFGSEQGHMVGFCEYGNELLGFIKFGEFLDLAGNVLASQA